MYNIIATEPQIQRTLHFMVPYFTSGDSSSCNICLLKTIWVFLCGHFMSRAAVWGTVWCKHRFNYEVGEFGRKVCLPGSVCCLKLIDVETSGLASGLQPGSNVRKAHCAAADKPGALSCVYSPQCKTADTPLRITQQLPSPKTPDKIRWRQSQTIPFPPLCPLWSCLPISHTASAEVR